MYANSGQPQKNNVPNNNHKVVIENVDERNQNATRKESNFGFTEDGHN